MKMNIRLTGELIPTDGNPRNSEGAFIRGKDGEIIFAYSRYCGISSHDHAECDIAIIRSYDEGESWTAPKIIARAKDFGTKNIMSVSALRLLNGDVCIFSCIKENDYSTGIVRIVSSDGVTFSAERCVIDCERNYYTLNNDRIVRLKSGRLLAPVAYMLREHNERYSKDRWLDCTFKTTLFYSDDDGVTFKKVSWDFEGSAYANFESSLLEPGVIEREDGSLFLWMRTCMGSQFESFSDGNIEKFSYPVAGRLTSPSSPLQIKEFDGEWFAVYNPIPAYNGRPGEDVNWGRTPLVIRRGKGIDTLGPLNVIEDSEERGYCYPAIFKTNDGHLLVSYCRGGKDDGGPLCRTGIAKIGIDDIL